MSAAPLTPEAFAEAANVSRETLTRMRAYADALRKFQKTVNLVGPATLADPWRRHFLDSAQLYPVLPQEQQPLTLLDIGSGAGFPGLVLAIMAEGRGHALDAHLVDVDARKCAFLREAARAAGVIVTVHNARVEEMAPFPVHVITARAFAPLPRLLQQCAGFLEMDGARPELLLLKGKSGQEELTEAVNRWKMGVDIQPSITDPGAMVLSLRGVSRD